MLLKGKLLALAGMVLILAAALCPFEASALAISMRYRSPRNPERKVRQSTELIVLHTTEAPARSSLNKLSDRGEAHFCVTEEGNVYHVVDRDREAFHAGRSMWKGREDVDKFSIGIECVGYHDKAMSTVQLTAIRELVKELQRMYRIPDECVVCHSHVAYGSPNKWHPHKHRGRKQCGMLFAMPSVRRVLGLRVRPACDLDTRAGRLVVGDPYLQGVLYGRTDTMVQTYAAVARPPEPPPAARPPPAPPRQQPSVAAKPQPAKPASAKPPGQQRPSLVAARAKAPPPKSVAQLKTQGYAFRGTVTKSNSAAKIAGKRWNAPDTYYTIRDKVIPGNTLNAARIEKGMCVWMKK